MSNVKGRPLVLTFILLYHFYSYYSMYTGCFELHVKGTASERDKFDRQGCRASAGTHILQKGMSCKAVCGNEDLFRAKVIGKGIPLHCNNAPALKGYNGWFVM